MDHNWKEWAEIVPRSRGRVSDEGVNHNGRYGKEGRVADGGSEEREQFPNAACLSDHHPTNILFTMNEEPI